MNKYMVRLFVLMAFLACMSFVTQSHASIQLTVGGNYYLGNIDPGTPTSPSDEVSYINDLITVAAGGSATIGSQDYDRAGSSLAGPFATATITDSTKEDSSLNTIDLGSMMFQYVYAKGGQIGSFVWYNAAGFTGVIELPSDLNGTGPGNGGGGLSHTSFYNKVDGVVPEPGAIAVWGVLALCGLVGVKKWR